VEKYDASADPSFGIARLDVSKEEMLGKLEIKEISTTTRFILLLNYRFLFFSL